MTKAEGPRVEIWIQNLTHFEIWILNPTLFEIWIQNPCSVWNLNPESLDPPLQGPIISQSFSQLSDWLMTIHP